jgi:cell wall-associated NlpC family hydrolase
MTGRPAHDAHDAPGCSWRIAHDAPGCSWRIAHDAPGCSWRIAHDAPLVVTRSQHYGCGDHSTPGTKVLRPSRSRSMVTEGRGMSQAPSNRAPRVVRTMLVGGLLIGGLGLVVRPGAAGATDTTVPGAPTSTVAPAPLPSSPPVTVPDSTRRIGTAAPAFQPAARPALSTARLLAAEAVPKLAASALDALSGRPAAASYPELRRRLAAAVASKITTATAADLDGAWAASSEARMTVVLTALAQVGKPYAYAVAGPNAFDCSGLVLFAWQTVGVSLKHQSEEQINQVPNVAAAQVRPGDIAWYPNHVALALGAGHAIVHAQQPGVPLGLSDWSDRTSRWGSPLP